jgi:hypothetical protein
MVKDGSGEIHILTLRSSLATSPRFHSLFLVLQRQGFHRAQVFNGADSSQTQVPQVYNRPKDTLLCRGELYSLTLSFNKHWLTPRQTQYQTLGMAKKKKIKSKMSYDKSLFPSITRCRLGSEERVTSNTPFLVRPKSWPSTAQVCLAIPEWHTDQARCPCSWSRALENLKQYSD